MRILLCWSSAEMSTFDVAAGMRAGLVEAGAEMLDYRLYRRWKLAYAGFRAFAPDDAEPDTTMVARAAAEALAHVALLGRADWVYVVSGMGLHPDSLVACRRAGVKVALHLTEAPYNTDEERELYLARLADVVFVNERAAVATVRDVLDRRGGQVHYLPHAYDPAVHHPDASADQVDDDDRADVVLVGTGFAERVALLEAIDWTGIRLRVHGIWPGIRAPSHVEAFIRDGSIRNIDTARLYRAAKIVVNPHRWTEREAESTNPRTYEAAACGAFQIADWRAELGELFGDAVPTYDAQVPWQAEALIRHYLADEPERRRLAELARERVQGQTFAARARQVVEVLEAVGGARGGRRNGLEQQAQPEWLRPQLVAAESR